jgi:hypothetical protein
MRSLIAAAVLFSATAPTWAEEMPQKQQIETAAHGVRPEDVLPDEFNTADFDGTTVRKGSVGAFLANARLLRDVGSSPTARDAARTQIIALVPALKALGVFDSFSVRDPELATLVESALAKQ